MSHLVFKQIHSVFQNSTGEKMFYKASFYAFYLNLELIFLIYNALL